MLPDANKLHSVIFSALRSALGLTASEADAHLIRAYSDVPSAEPAPSVNVCYYLFQTEAHAVPLQETEITGSISSVSAFIPCILVLVFYGPDCESWAHRCRIFLFRDGHDSPRHLLRRAGIYPVPSSPSPSVFYEETGKVHRKRADLTIPCRLLTAETFGSVTTAVPAPVDTVASALEVRIHTVP